MFWFSIFALLLLSCLGWMAFKQALIYCRNGAVPPSSWVCYGVFYALAIFCLVLSAMGLPNSNAVDAFGTCNMALVFAGGAMLARHSIRRVLLNVRIFGHRFPAVVFEIVLVALGAYLAQLAFEIPVNPNLVQMNGTGFLIEFTMILMVVFALHLLTLRTGIGAAAGVVLAFFCGMAEYFVVLFKGIPIGPGDILGLGTAAAVAGGYVYELTPFALYAAAIFVAALMLVLLAPARPLRKGIARRLIAGLGGGVALFVLLISLLFNVPLASTFGVTVNNWSPLASYRIWGGFTALAMLSQQAVPSQPEGYTNEKASELLASYAQAYDDELGSDPSLIKAQEQFKETDPSIVVIMNESYADLSIFDELHAGYEGPAYLHNPRSTMSQSLAQGTAYVPAYGGGTCNSEFEFLTNVSYAFMSAGINPYSMYDLSGVDNLAGQFEELGYETVAIHANLATNWNRKVVYESFGFEKFLDIESFDQERHFHNASPDSENYDLIVDLLEDSSRPQFIFNVTMQNHGGYTQGDIPEYLVKHYRVDGAEPDPQLDEYLALIDESDRALEAFLKKLDTLDRPVVVIFFGDHQPGFTVDINNRLFPDEEDQVAHLERVYASQYLIWANYHVADSNYRTQELDTSLNYLSAFALQQIGAPLTDYQKAVLMISQSLPVFNVAGYYAGDDESWHRLTEEHAGVLDMKTLCYLQMFDKGVQLQTNVSSNGWKT